MTFPISENEYVRLQARIEHREPAAIFARLAELKRGDVDGTGEEAVELVLGDGSLYPRPGLVVAFNRQVDSTTGTIAVQALFPNPGNFLRPGQFARVRMHRRSAGALVVPEAALFEVQGTFQVAVVGAGGKVQVRRVDVGTAVDGLRIIGSGVGVGEAVVVGGVQKVTDGATVVASPAAKTIAAPAATVTRAP